MCRTLNRRSQKFFSHVKNGENLPCVSSPLKTNGRKNGQTGAEQYGLHNVLLVQAWTTSHFQFSSYLHSVGFFYPKKIHMLILGTVFKRNKFTFTGGTSAKWFIQFWKGMLSIRQEFSPKGSKSFALKVDPFSKGVGEVGWGWGANTVLRELSPLKMYLFLRNEAFVQIC